MQNAFQYLPYLLCDLSFYIIINCQPYEINHSATLYSSRYIIRIKTSVRQFTDIVNYVDSSITLSFYIGNVGYSTHVVFVITSKKNFDCFAYTPIHTY